MSIHIFLFKTVLHGLTHATENEKVPGTFCPSESVEEASDSEIREVPGTLFPGQGMTKAQQAELGIG